jgi:7-keto-8-aminopelargonate synthetase-like enzyme/REP element-mobilizing transposase RayT
MSRLDEQLGAELAQLRKDGLYRQLRTVASAQGSHVVIEGREFLNFSSNDYLGLASDPVLKRASAAAIKKYGVGAGASRLVSGNLAPYDELEAKLARFKGKEAAIVFGSGYAANVGTITALVGEGDVVILDKLDHASIIDGARQSGATVRVYPHRNLKKLEELLRGATAGRGQKPAPTTAVEEESSVGAASRPRPGRVLIVTESVFSMDGDRAPLAEIVALKEKYDAWLMVDEAHATGVFGKNRRGLAEELGVEAQVDVILGTLSKALGCAGGFVAGSQTLVDFLRNRARSLIYSTALPPSVVAAASAAVELVMGEEGRRRQEKLWANVRALGAESPIHPVIVGDETAAVELSRRLYEQGIFVPAIRYPTVAKGKARLRVTVTAGHTAEDVERLGEVLAGGRGQKFTRRRRRQRRPGPAPTGEVESNVGATFRSRPGEQPHSSALRRGRVSLPAECYFVTTCVAGKRPLLKDTGARAVIEALRWLREEGRIRLLGFVVMPDHLHLAIALRSRAEARSHREELGNLAVRCGSDLLVATLPEVMRSLKGFTGKRLTEELGLPSPLWQDGYHDNLLRDRREFEKRLEYMHDNPRRCGLVNRAEEYPFSTAHPDYANEIDWGWLEAAST